MSYIPAIRCTECDSRLWSDHAKQKQLCLECEAECKSFDCLEDELETLLNDEGK